MIIPFTKAHGAKNDFLLAWAGDLPPELGGGGLAASICDRHSGVGADGLLSVSLWGRDEVHAAIRLWNSDGSEAELSGNGTRCAAAFLCHSGLAGASVTLKTAAGRKTLKLVSREAQNFVFEMNMGQPAVEPDSPRAILELSTGPRQTTILNAGNPQCAVLVDDFFFDWRAMGAEIERHPQFPERTNVSFVRVVDSHTLDVRFFERGAGETMSSGTGSTGAAAAALYLGLIQDPVTVRTPAGPLQIRVEHDFYLTGPAVLIADGRFWWNPRAV